MKVLLASRLLAEDSHVFEGWSSNIGMICVACGDLWGRVVSGEGKFWRTESSLCKRCPPSLLHCPGSFLQRGAFPWWACEGEVPRALQRLREAHGAPQGFERVLLSNPAFLAHEVTCWLRYAEAETLHA